MPKFTQWPIDNALYNSQTVVLQGPFQFLFWQIYTSISVYHMITLVHLCVYVYACMHAYIQICIPAYKHMHLYKYTYIYTYICSYAYMETYDLTHTNRWFRFQSHCIILLANVFHYRFLPTKVMCVRMFVCLREYVCPQSLLANQFQHVQVPMFCATTKEIGGIRIMLKKYKQNNYWSKLNDIFSIALHSCCAFQPRVIC